MLVKDPAERIKLEEIKVDPWVTGYGMYPMLRKESNCGLIEVTDDEVENSVKSIPKLDTLILVKVNIGTTYLPREPSQSTLHPAGDDKETFLCKSISKFPAEVREEWSL